MHFDSYEASTKVNGLDWPPKLDETLPASPAARRAMVRELYAAMIDMSDVQDKVGNVFKKRWSSDQDSPPENAFAPWELEKKCWELLVSGTDMPGSADDHCLQKLQHILEKLYREGASFMSILDRGVLKEAEKWHHLTLQERKDLIVKLVRSFKCRINALMRGSCTEEYVFNVGKLLKESKVNRINNDMKQGQIVEGRKREREDSTGNPNPPKRSRPRQPSRAQKAKETR
jgi:hypothetical protein